LEDELSYSTTNISILLQKGVQGLKYERLEKDIRKSSGAKSKSEGEQLPFDE
jgi:hypothetical protein